jgi:hypothetical protein
VHGYRLYHIHFVYLFITMGHLDYFCVLDIMNDGRYVSVWTCFIGSLGVSLGVEFQG